MSFAPMYIWLVVGLLLLTVEALGYTGFFFGMAIAALVTAAYAWLAAPVDLQATAWVFAPLAIVLTWAYWRYFRKFNSATDAPGLNQRGAALVGKGFNLSKTVGLTPIAHFIGDTRWQIVASEHELEAGTAVVVAAQRQDGVLEVSAAK